MFSLIILQLLIPWSSVLREKLTCTQPIINFPHFMEPKELLLNSQAPPPAPSTEPDQFSPSSVPLLKDTF